MDDNSTVRGIMKRSVNCASYMSNSKCVKGENLNCKVLSVMMRHLNAFNCFSFGNESLWTLTILV